MAGVNVVRDGTGKPGSIAVTRGNLDAPNPEDPPMKRLGPSHMLLWLVLVGIVLATTSSASAGLVMRVDSANKLFYMDGSDTGNGTDRGFGSYNL